MALPSDFPPAEIIKGLEIELGLPFQYFMVSLDGEIEALFTDGMTEQIVSFEIKRTLTEYEIPSMESIMESLDEDAVESVKDALKEMVEQIESRIINDEDLPEITITDYAPKFDDDWYCP
jgi:predicted component of type VI protein secretion system